MGGTGLGLSIAKDLLDRNGGSIDIKSEVGKRYWSCIKVPNKGKINFWQNLKYMILYFM